MAATVTAQAPSSSSAPSPSPNDPRLKNFILYDIDRVGGPPGSAVVASGGKKIEFDYDEAATNRLILRVNGNGDTQSIKITGSSVFKSCYDKQKGIFVVNADLSGADKKVFPIPTGSYNLKVTPYAGASCSGTAGDSKDLVVKAMYKGTYCFKGAPAVVGYRYLTTKNSFKILKINSKVCLKTVDILGGGRNLQAMYVDCKNEPANQIRIVVEKPVSSTTRSIGPPGLLQDEMLAPIGTNPQKGIDITLSGKAKGKKNSRLSKATELTFKSKC